MYSTFTYVLLVYSVCMNDSFKVFLDSKILQFFSLK